MLVHLLEWGQIVKNIKQHCRFLVFVCILFSMSTLKIVVLLKY